MATGASTCELAILLIDARKGVLDQTRRHSFISTLLGIKHLVVAINKMDLVDYSEETFTRIREDYLTFAGQLPGNLDIRFVPLSALEGDNVASQSESMPWYSGPTLLEVLETVEIQRVVDAQPMRFPVQYVNRPNLDFRGYAGTLASGRVEVGQRVKVLPSGVESNVARIVTLMVIAKKPLPEKLSPVLTDGSTSAVAICCWRQTKRYQLCRARRWMWYGWRNSRFPRARVTTSKLPVRRRVLVLMAFVIRLILITLPNAKLKTCR